MSDNDRHTHQRDPEGATGCAPHGHCHCHSHAHDHSHGHGHDHGSSAGSGILRVYRTEIISAIILLAALILEHTGVFGQIARVSGLSAHIPEIIVYLIALVPVGWPVVREMAESWRNGSFMNEFTLMTAAAAGAFIIGEYPEGVAVLLFYSFGEKMEGTASDDVKRRIKALLGRLPDHAFVKENGSLVKKDPRSLKPGSVIVVKPGERVAIDGILRTSQDIDFDTSAITGESVPRAYSPGEEVASGMIPIDKAVEVETVRPFEDSSMSRIMRMIEDAQASKSPTENLLRRITRWYTPTVFILALAVFMVPWAFSAAGGHSFEWMQWLRRALVFLVCSCPCALVVSIPLSYFASLGSASRRGLLFKGSKYVDAIREIDTVVFDKTGTLTTGKFHVCAVSPAAGITADTVLATAAALDTESTHPLAEAIVEKARQENTAVPAAQNVTGVPHGVTGTVAGQEAAAGSRTLMTKLGVSVPYSESDASEICVCLNGKYIGSVYLLDTVKPEAAEAIRRLHALGIKDVEILSGDREAAVKRTAGTIGADSWKSSLLPADKKDAVTKLVDEGRKVAFVGDGINDAPAIAAASVGVAMGSMGTDIAMQSSDVVIAGDNLEKLPEAITLARKVRHVVVENVSFALGVKALVMILGAFGIASLWAAVFADTGVTLVTIAWTLLRLRR